MHYQFGWGIINAQSTQSPIETAKFYEGAIASTGDQIELDFTFDGGDLAVTLGWTDPAGDPAAAKALVGTGLGDASVKSFVVSNQGALQLEVTNIALKVAAPWITLAPSSFSLPGGADQIVTVSVNFAQAPAGFSGTQFDIVSNDPDESPYAGGLTVNLNTPVVDTDGDGLTDDIELL